MHAEIYLGVNYYFYLDAQFEVRIDLISVGLEQRFSTRGDFAPKETFGNI